MFENFVNKFRWKREREKEKRSVLTSFLFCFFIRLFLANWLEKNGTMSVSRSCSCAFIIFLDVCVRTYWKWCYVVYTSQNTCTRKMVSRKMETAAATAPHCSCMFSSWHFILTFVQLSIFTIYFFLNVKPVKLLLQTKTKTKTNRIRIIS